MSATTPRNRRWANRNEEERLRCRATEFRNGKLVQCSEDRRTEHEHQSRGKKFAPGYSMPPEGGPTLPPSQVSPR